MHEVSHDLTESPKSTLQSKISNAFKNTILRLTNLLSFSPSLSLSFALPLPLIRGFAAAQDYRNKEKEAHARCHRIAKNAKSGSQPSTTMSWGGGGAAGVSTSTGSGRGRGRMGGGGRSKGRKTMPPAWALAASQEQEQGEENGDDREDEEC